MVIGIDASKASLRQRTGVEEVVYRLCLNLPKIDPNNTYRLYTQESLPLEIKKLPNVQERRLFSPLFWNRLRLPIELLLHKPDVLIIPGYRIPSFAPQKTITFIHDFAYYRFPQAYSKLSLYQQKAAAKRTAKKSAIIIFPSQSTYNDFVQNHVGSPAKTVIIPLGFDDQRFRPLKNGKDVLNLKDKYFLFVGRLEERKNILRIIKAFDQFRQITDKQYKLVLIGQESYGITQIKRAINQSRCKKDIILPGYVDSNDLAFIYSGAEAFIFPSLYEGFGIPLLEAFASGVPVITSSTSSLPEVAGDAAILVDPQSVDEISRAMSKITNNESLRHDLIKRGLDRTEQFSWQKTAERVLEVIKSF